MKKNIHDYKISDFFTVDDFLKLKNYNPRTRDEYLAHAQCVYNLKLHTPFPLVIHIETTNICNQKCIMCQHPSMKRKAMHIEPEIAKKAIDECAREKKAWFLHFFFFGEPFLNKKTLKYMKYAKQKGIENISTTTNFTAVTKEEIKKLVDYEITSVHVSFEGLNRDSYKKIRRTDSYEKVMQNIIDLLDYREKKNSRYPWVAITYVRTTETEKEISAFKKKWGKVVNDLHISPQFHYLGRSELTRSSTDVYSGQIMSRFSEERIPCRQLWLRMVVMSNGEMTPCSQNMEGELSLGNIRETSISDAWTGRKMALLRMQHISNIFNENCICDNCIDWDWSGKIEGRPKI